MMSAKLVRLIVILVVLAGASMGARAQEASPLMLGPRIDASDFRVTVFARDLFFPMGMVRLPDGSLLVATSVPAIGGYFGSAGELRRFVDEDRDGVADDGGTVVADGLPGTIVALAYGGDLVFVTSAEAGRERISVLRRGGSWAEPLSPAGSINFRFVGFDHQSYGLAMQPVAGETGRYEVYFNVGASGNDTAGRTVNVTGLVTATLEDASLYRVVIEDTGGEPTVSEPMLVATGLRNAAAFVFEPKTGDVLIAENGIDTPSNRIVALSADEIDRVPADAIEDEPIDFGFPESYVDYQTGETVGNRGTPPAVAFLPLDGSQNEGAASIAIAPGTFPEGLNDGVFVGFHGQWDDSGLSNEENPLLYADTVTGEVIAFVANDDPVAGHFDSLLTTDDALFVADLCGGPDGSLIGNVPCGVIYEIRTTKSAGDGTG